MIDFSAVDIWMLFNAILCVPFWPFDKLVLDVDARNGWWGRDCHTGCTCFWQSGPLLMNNFELIAMLLNDCFGIWTGFIWSSFFIIDGNLLFCGWIAETPATSHTAWAWKLLTFAVFHEQQAQLFGWTHHRKRLFIFQFFLNYFLLFSHHFCISAPHFLLHTCVHSQNEVYIFRCDQFEAIA